VVVGSIEVTAVLDAIGPLGALSELYPEVSPEEWEPYRALYPDLFAGSDWRLPCRSYVIRTGKQTVLVDTGLGPAGLSGWRMEREGELMDGLAVLGVTPGDVNVVFLTHLHSDHVGWNTDADGVVAFPQARYLVHPDAVAFARAQDQRPHVQRCIRALADRFESVGDASEVAPGVTAFDLPGHYPGHMGLHVVSEDARLDLIADAAVHPALLAEPEWVYVSDGSLDTCAATRLAYVPTLVDSETFVACGHYPGSAIGRVVQRDGQVMWEDAG
jgi:glyoxylase-like metal-dependent hydrolase (beta-lactamase superfamily II)